MRIERAAIADIATLINGFVGLLAIMYIIDGNFKYGMALILLGVLIDGADGSLARYFGRNQGHGAYLDSIADMVTFCFAPTILLYKMYYDLELGTSFQNLENALTVTACMLVVLFGILRLARFIEGGHESKNYIGLPTPAAAIIIVMSVEAVAHQFAVLLATIIMSLLMISKIRFPKLQGILRGVATLVILTGMVSIWLQNEYSFTISTLVLVVASIYVVIGPLYTIKHEGE